MNELALLSLMVTLIFTEAVGLVPGGIVVPFYFALYLEEPVKIAATLISALAAVGSCLLYTSTIMSSLRIRSSPVTPRPSSLRPVPAEREWALPARMLTTRSSAAPP